MKTLQKQITNTLLMIRPAVFRMNLETVVNNYFQKELNESNDEITKKAQQEFDEFVTKLRKVGVTVIVENDKIEYDTPDSIFPNNWVSFHQNGDVALYPMFAKNRRRERRESVLIRLEEEGFQIHNLIDYTSAEEEEVYLEGTGSMVLDRVNKKAYTALSTRTDEDLVIEFCEDFEYTPVVFNAYQTVEGKRLPIYHTNVLMALGENIAIICLDAIDSKSDKKEIIQNLKQDGKEIIKITEAQMHQFAGNMLQIKGAFDINYMVMSTAAFKSLTEDQIVSIEKSSKILHSELTIIETLGGGSARCMLAEVFLPRA
ncbi:MAG: amidinotransferase [Flavobacterium sp.]|nr:MAG: amidinotransferase [Flavobacterium sp.]